MMARAGGYPTADGAVTGRLLGGHIYTPKSQATLIIAIIRVAYGNLSICFDGYIDME